MAFQASDMEKTLAFYKDILGYSDFLRIAANGGRPERVFVRINGLQYVELQGETLPMSDRMIQYGFITEDAEALRLYLAAKGLDVPKACAVGALGNLGFKMKDPDGHTVDFVQYLSGGWPMRTGSATPATKPLSEVLLHIGFIVWSLDKSMAFYRDILGFTEMWRGSADDKTLSWVQLKLPEDRNYIELMLYDEPPSLERLGILNHYGLEVPSVPASVEGLPKLPKFAEYKRPLMHKVGTCRHRLSNLFDPDGTRAELMERATFDLSVTPSSSAPPPH
jgi:lactoylglutathione lyase